MVFSSCQNQYILFDKFRMNILFIHLQIYLQGIERFFLIRDVLQMIYDPRGHTLSFLEFQDGHAIHEFPPGQRG